ncbi:histone deacetylase domain-containing protein [Dipodascopsis uninucleata]
MSQFPSFSFTALLDDTEGIEIPDDVVRAVWEGVPTESWNAGEHQGAAQTFNDQGTSSGIGTPDIKQEISSIPSDVLGMPLRDTFHANPANDSVDLEAALERLKIEEPDATSAKLPLQAKAVPQVLVVINSLAVQHVFSRDWVPKRHLAYIVERPERMRACAMGIGAAIALTGDDGRMVVEKTEKRTSLESDYVTKVHGKDWPKQLSQLCDAAPTALADGKLEVPDNWNSGDIYLCPGTIPAVEGTLGAVETAIDRVFDKGQSMRRAFVGARPPGHHCHVDMPSGFCLLNNVHVGIQYAATKHGLTDAVILDFDLHHGDGSQNICWQLRGDTDGPRIGYFSLHDVNSFPTEPEVATPAAVADASTCVSAHGAFIWNIHLESYSTIEEFDSLYKKKYSTLFVKAREFLSKRRNGPAAIFLSAGFDASEYEDKGMQRHGVHVPTEFYSRFTSDAVDLANEFCEGRVVSVLEGGYATTALASGVMSHLLGLLQIPLTKYFPSSKSFDILLPELVRGTRSRWSSKNANNINSWLANAVNLGRSLVPPPPSLPSSATASPRTRMVLRNR